MLGAEDFFRNRKSKEAMKNRFAMIPTYAELFEELAVGFGVASSPALKLSTARSWLGKQERYSTKTSRQESRGLLEDLLILLAGEEPGVAAELHRCFLKYEGLLSHLRARTLFSRRSRLDGLACFLAGWVFPQVAVLLWRGKNRYGPSSPLFHLLDVLPPFGDGDYDVVRRVKQAVRAQLPAKPEASTAEFRHALNKLDVRSDKSLKTMQAELKALEDELWRPRADAGRSASVVSRARAAYVAGMAVKRFLGRLSKLKPGNPVPVLSLVRDYYAMLEEPDKDPEEACFVRSHLQLFDELMSSDLEYVVDPNRHGSPFLSLVDCHWKAVRAIVSDECAPLRPLLALLIRSPVNATAFLARMTAFQQHPDYDVLRPYAEVANARFALAQGDACKALAACYRVLADAERQQQGWLGEFAASRAIALEIATNARWRPGCLDPLITYLPQTTRQQLTVSVKHYPTPFSDWSDPPQITSADELVLYAIHQFNTRPYATVEGVERIFCNPLTRFDSMIGTFFAHIDEENVQSVGRELVIQHAIDRTFNPTTRARSVIRFLHVTPYEALRDLWFYVARLFGPNGLARFSELNPYLARYLGLPENEARGVLCALDRARYDKDTNRWAADVAGV